IEKMGSPGLNSLMVMPSKDTITSSPYIYISKIRKSNIGLVDCREYAVLGDRVKYNPELADKMDWYIMTTGDQGRPLVDAASTQAYNYWCAHIRTSKLYKLESVKTLPDRSLLQLYHRVPDKH